MFILRIKQRWDHIKGVAHNLSSNEIEKKKIIKCGWQNLLRDQVGLRGRPLFFKLKKFGKEYCVSINNVSDFSLLYDLLVKEAYQRVKTLKRVSSIIDLGSNVGFSVIYFYMLFPEALITGYEPDPQNYLQLLINLAPVRGVQVHPYAVGSTTEEVDFFTIPCRGVSSSLINRKGSTKPIRVKQVTLDDILKNYGKKEIDLLKFDVEGAEYRIFKQSQSINRVKTYIGELHTDLMGCDIATFCRLFDGYKIELEEISSNREFFFAKR